MCHPRLLQSLLLLRLVGPMLAVQVRRLLAMAGKLAACAA